MTLAIRTPPTLLTYKACGRIQEHGGVLRMSPFRATSPSRTLRLTGNYSRGWTKKMGNCYLIEDIWLRKADQGMGFHNYYAGFLSGPVPTHG